MLPARAISRKNMAVDRLDHSLDDSLEMAQQRLLPSRAAAVGPEDSSEKPDFRAFSEQDEEDLGIGGSLCPELLPRGDVLLLQDRASGKNRAVGVERLQAAVQSVESCTVLERKLPALVEEACSAVGDTHIKVCLVGLQLLDPLIRRTGSSLTPHIPAIVEAVLTKMGRNKHVLKRTGMETLVQLMHYSRPHDVVTEVTVFGLRHKQSKVREEALNVITAALIRFSSSEFRLDQLARVVVPLLGDTKPNVRQASMECATKIASLCDPEDFGRVMSLAARNGHHTPHHLPALEALKCRIVRECGPPRLKEDGLVQYAMPVVGVEVPLSQHGPDVDWIRDGALSGEPNGLEGSSVGRTKEARLRPFRSATKKLPWETEEAERSKLCKDGNLTNSHLSDTTADLNTTFTQPRAPKNSTLPHQQPPSSKLLFAKDRSGSPPSHRPPTGRRQLAPLSDTDKKPRTPPRSPNGSGSTLLMQDLRDMVPPPSRGGPLPRPIPPPGAKFSRRHQSLPGRANHDLPTSRLQPRRVINGSPRLSPNGSHKVNQPPSDILPPPATATATAAGGELSESWPRSRVGARGNKMMAVATPAKRGELITADPLKAVGAVGDPVQTSLHRPPSKPRARNPLSKKQKQEAKTLKPSLVHHHQQQLQQTPQDSPTQTEKEFLMCANTTLQDEDYYSSVPEDNTGMDNSLSSSLTSLCRPTREPPQPPRNTEVGKAVGTQKTQHRSAGCSLSHSPQATHDETPVGHPHREPGEGTPERRAKTGVRVEKDFNRTFTLGESLAHADPSAITWQTLQALTQTAPLPPGPEQPPAPGKKTKKKKKSGGNGGSGSSEGSGTLLLERRSRANSTDSPTGDAGHSQRVKQTRKEPAPDRENGGRVRRSVKLVDEEEGCRLPAVQRRTRALGPEGRRPTIERGGTDVIRMEVNGVKSPPPHLSPEDELSPPAVHTKGGTRKKQGHSEPAFSFGGERKMAQFGSSPKASRGISFTEDSPDSSEGLLPEVSRQPKKKQSKYAVTRGRDDRLAQSNGHKRRRSMEESVAENGSPQNGSLSPDLQPFSSPEKGLRVSLSQLDSSDWNEKCEGLLGVRRLAALHTPRLVPELHTVALAVVKEVENLRSSVARVAMACMGDMFVYTGRQMDPELERVVKVLLLKSGESNVFIREDVEKTMCEIVQHASPGKLLLALITGGIGHGSSQVRRTAAQFLSQTVEQYGPAQLLHAPKDLLERTLIATLNCVTDAAVDPRYYGRVCLSHFMEAADFEKVASRTLNSKQWSKMRDVVEMIRVKGVGDPPSEAATARSRQPTGGPVRAPAAHHPTKPAHHVTKAAHHVTKAATGGPKMSTAVHCGDHPALPDRLVERLNAGDWEDRLEAINVLERFVDHHPKALEPHMNKVFDAFNPRLTDRNSKVNLRALEAFSNMVPLLGSLLAPLSANIIKALMPNLGSKNSGIYHSATNAFDLFSQCIDPAHLIQPIATHSQHGNARIQPIMINKLAELTGEIYGHNQKIVVRQVLPVMWHFLASKPPGSNDVKEAIVGFCETLYDLMGQELLGRSQNLPPQSQTRLNQLLRSRNYN